MSRDLPLASTAMRVLVTGHHGYIGSVLAPALRDAGHDVVGLDAFYFRGCDFGEDTELEPALALDLRDVRPADLEGLDAVVHLAALSNDPLGDLNLDWSSPSTATVRSPSRARPRRPGCAGSSLPPPAVCTAPPPETPCSPRTLPFTR